MSLSRAIRRALLLLQALVTLTARGAAAQQPVQPPYRDPARPVDERVRDLLGRMTREEKFWQLFMIPGDLDDPAHDYSHGIFGLQIRMPRDRVAMRPPRRANTPSASTPSSSIFVEQTRLGIPIIPFEEAVHGFVASRGDRLPQAIGLAATGTPRSMARVAAAIARRREVAACGRSCHPWSTSRTTSAGAASKRPTGRIRSLLR